MECCLVFDTLNKLVKMFVLFDTVTPGNITDHQHSRKVSEISQSLDFFSSFDKVYRQCARDSSFEAFCWPVIAPLKHSVGPVSNRHAVQISGGPRILQQI